MIRVRSVSFLRRRPPVHEIAVGDDCWGIIIITGVHRSRRPIIIIPAMNGIRFPAR
jgi:hypothetical protein